MADGDDNQVKANVLSQDGEGDKSSFKKSKTMIVKENVDEERMSEMPPPLADIN